MSHSIANKFNILANTSNINLTDKVNYVGYYQNVRGLRTKLDYLRCNIHLINFDYCILTETWLTPDFYDSELGFDNYRLFRFDRNENTSPYSRGGGTLIAVKTKFATKLLSVPINNVEQLFVLVTFGNKRVILGGVYIPPGSCSDIYDNHIRAVEILHSIYSTSLLFWVISICHRRTMTTLI